MNHRAAAISIAFALAATVSPASSATTRTVAMRDVEFAPQSKIVPMGGYARWVNEGEIFHTTTKYSAFPGTWDKGLNPGGAWSLRMPAAGAFVYYCKPHSDGTNGMRGNIRVPVITSASSIPLGKAASLRFSLSRIGDEWGFDIQYKRNSGSWTNLRDGYRGATMSYRPSAKGTYLVRARLRYIPNGRKTAYSPAAKIVVK
jgi:plastocyanin